MYIITIPYKNIGNIFCANLLQINKEPEITSLLTPIPSHTSYYQLLFLYYRCLYSDLFPGGCELAGPFKIRFPEITDVIPPQIFGHYGLPVLPSDHIPQIVI